jgi:hypothetical protein
MNKNEEKKNSQIINNCVDGKFHFAALYVMEDFLFEPMIL